MTQEEHFVKIPKDLSLIKQKFVFGLTKRQAVCFGIGLIAGMTAFYVFNGLLGLQAGCFALGIAAAPAIFCGLYKKNGLHFEQTVKFMIDFFRKPKERTYQSENTFDIISRQIEYIKLKKITEQSENKRR